MSCTVGSKSSFAIGPLKVWSSTILRLIKEAMNESQVNPQSVINSLVRQIADQAQKIAFLEALLEASQNSVNAAEDSDVG